MRSIKTYLDILRKKGLYTCMLEAKKAVWPVWWTHSRAAIEQIQAERASKYLWRYYKELITKPLDDTRQAKKPTRVVWLCWLQGMENAPEIVKKCVDSVKRNMPKYEVRVLTAENLFNYVTLPEHIVRKYQKGTITFTHFSDILRTALLVQHGGIWMDATVLMTGSLPEEIVSQSLFFFQKSPLSAMPHFASSWFIVADQSNPVMKRMLELLSAYWKKENVLKDYFLFHLFLYLLMTHNEQAKTVAQAMPYIPNVDVHQLGFSCFDSYSVEAWQRMTERSAIHKLTWKFNHNEPLEKRGTNYDYILHHMHL